VYAVPLTVCDQSLAVGRECASGLGKPHNPLVFLVAPVDGLETLMPCLALTRSTGWAQRRGLLTAPAHYDLSVQGQRLTGHGRRRLGPSETAASSDALERDY